MKPNYTYTPSPEFIGNLDFDYMETYSFQRGDAFEENQKLNEMEYDQLRIKQEKSSGLSTEEAAKHAALHDLLGFTQYLINSKGQFHPSSRKMNTFTYDAPIVTRLKNILLTEVNEIPHWLCTPVYRDAIVFYKNDKIVETLNVCLSCQYMEITMFNHINADYQTYDLLKRFFIDIGHEVERPDYFPLDEINRLKEKYKK
jgi:hypothetical protein